jgi:hypothetical protein
MSFYPIQLDKMRNFKYGMKALHLIEKKLKKPVSKIDMDNLTMEDAATLIWAGLQHEDKDLTPDKVMDLVDEYSNIPAVMQAMGKAFAAAFGADAPEEDAKNE